MRGGRPRQCHLIKAGRPRPKPTVAAQPSVLKLTRLVRFRTSSDDRESVVVDRRARGLLVGQNRTRCIHGMGCAFSRSGFGRAERGQPALMQCHLRIIAERLNAADAARALRSPPEGNPVPIAARPSDPITPCKAVGTTHHPIRTRPGPPGARGLSVLWHTGCLPTETWQSFEMQSLQPASRSSQSAYGT